MPELVELLVRPDVALGFIVFVVSTGAGLYLYYLYREPFAARGMLESFPRFINLPLRILLLEQLVDFSRSLDVRGRRNGERTGE